MTRHPFPPCALFALALVCFSVGTTATLKAADDRPNIIFFLTDDQRNDTLSCAGHDIVKTPNIDRLAKEGVRFENAFVTTSICWISRSTLLTGQWNGSHSKSENVNLVNDAAASTIYPQLLKEAGYRTGFAGKWHARMPKDFDRNKVYDMYERIGRNPFHKKMPDGSTRHETELIGDAGEKFIKSNPEGKPFALQLWFNAAHAEDGDHRPGIGHFPWPKATDGLYEDIKIPAPHLSDPKIFESQPDFLKKSINRERYYWRWDTPEKYTINMRAYYRMLTGIDNVVGRIVKTLEEQGLAENTIIVYSADNGYYMGDRGFAGKWSHYEQSIRVPMIVFDPRLSIEKRGRVDSHLVLNVDLPSTFLAAAGIEEPERYQGKNMLLLVRGEKTDWRTDFFAEHILPFGARIPKWEGVRNDRFIYARYYEYNYEFLHDLNADPDQLRNDASNPEYSKTLKQLRSRTDELKAVYESRRGK